LTQLPAAASLTGDARTQVSQLIANFNELITTTVEWRASYAKVQTNLNTLIGDQRADESPATPTTAAPGAVGTAGTVALDPAIRAKLEEFRTHLREFEKVAGGGANTASAAAPEATPSSTAEPSATMPSNTTAAGSTSAPPTGAAASPAAPTSSSPAEPPVATGTTGATSTAPSPAGTSGTTPADPEAQSRPAPATTPQSSQEAAAKQGHTEALRHIEAIEAILNGRTTASSDSPAGTAGGAGGSRATGPTSLDREQIEKLRTHVAELRRALSESGGR
jgi:hypothetical protein